MFLKGLLTTLFLITTSTTHATESVAVHPSSIRVTEDSTCHMKYSYFNDDVAVQGFVTSTVKWDCGTSDTYGVNMLKSAALALTTSKRVKVTTDNEGSATAIELVK